MEKQKGGNIGALDKHHERAKEAYQSNPDIDPARTPLNHHLKQPEGRYYHEVQRRIEAAHCRVRSDSVKMVDVYIGASPGFVKELPAGEQLQFFQHAYDFMSRKVGADNIFVALVHEDEENPHMHLCFVPLTPDKRLSAKEILGNRKDMCRWQDEYHAHMSARWPDLERGEPAVETQRKHQPVQEYKRTHQSPEFIELWQQHERLKRRWRQVPYEMRKDIVDRERHRKQDRTRSTR
jgi:hypothetical protein